MAVPGRKKYAGEQSELLLKIVCEPCSLYGSEISSDGYCKECEENMCSTCFKHHRKGKLCRNHVFLPVGCSDVQTTTTKQSDGLLDKCHKHVQEIVKFYCPTHEVTGCRDCIIFEHKPCDITYITDISIGLDETEYIGKVVKEIDTSTEKVKELQSKIQTNINSTHTVHKKFTCDVHQFKERILEKMDKLTVDACEQATGFKTETLSLLGNLEIEASNIMEELSSMQMTTETEKNEPIKYFITAKRLGKRLDEIKKKLTDIGTKNVAREYTFLKNRNMENIENAIETCKGIDFIQNCEKDVKQGKQNFQNGNLTKRSRVTWFQFSWGA
ncbi:E3 ubiquitin-protein ligase TRIM33-like isoform X2 [Ruditapes philippinarum]|uniref:E3 ubiquitin-protein ligase TRIM33-like isoform X2 n=1 Tax=Ruditapes philippinarum TaxID=129788 RepID=UPI00295BE41A|nr:E3 ubiquitin-protein ligase TRIM33-like isoform X2 [Ruditapes philippinarum]